MKEPTCMEEQFGPLEEQQRCQQCDALRAELETEKNHYEVQVGLAVSYREQSDQLREQLKVAVEALTEIEALQPLHERERRSISRVALAKIRGTGHAF